LLSGFGSVSHDENYECAGKNDNGMVSFREFPTLHISGRRLKIAGPDIFSTYSYEICDEADPQVFFATRPKVCRSKPADITSLDSSNGYFNKVSGRLELFGAQGLHGDYQCKEAKKK
jgi:hypothetical protein